MKTKNESTAQNEISKPATVTLGGRTYELKFDLQEIAATEQIWGCNLLGALSELQKASASQICGLLRAYMTAADRKLTLPEFAAVSKLIQFNQIPDIANAIAEATLLSATPTE